MIMYTESNQGNDKGKRALRRQSTRKHHKLGMSLLLIITLHVLIGTTEASSLVPTMSPHEHTAWPTSEACWFVFVKIHFNAADPAKISYKFERLKEDGSGYGSDILFSSNFTAADQPEYNKEECFAIGKYMFTIVDDDSEEVALVSGVAVQYWLTTNNREVIAQGQYFGQNASTSFPLPTEQMQSGRF
eukprot:207841_1